MSGYSWPDAGQQLGDRARKVWLATVAALPLGRSVVGEVIARQPFGVFIRIDGVPDAVGLIELTAIRRGTELPALATHVTGEVIGHAEHNHQVRIRLTRE